ncbi:Mce associated membrane protein [Mycobacterium europaeum]|uniref:Mce associated membrane protein n=1 Tax=Mycobacterium europaeum TaxID=761804 RepID=A0A0U1DKL7_9MYCO|nr:Mce protein [Mycobacterium europaeum]CQD18342.1 Mce associated membrane protein [Mycobacterium europaeum]
MAEHADASQEELSETDLAEATPASVGHTDEGSSELPSQVTSNEKSPEAAPASAQAPEGLADEADDYDAAVDDEVDDASEDAVPVKKRMSPVGLATVLGLVTVVSLGALAGWFGFRIYQSHQAQEQRQLLVRVGRQGALNLTTVDWQHADADIQRILDSATGTFYDDFSNRSKPFIDVVKKAQSKSVGTITEAGLESQSGNEAQVLVAVSVKTSNLGAAEQDPRHWRMRISVQKVGNDTKISKVEFVP